MADPAYNDPDYRAAKAHLELHPQPCWRGCGRVATSPDHHPPLKHHNHVRGSGCCELMPACKPCQDKQGAAIRNQLSATGYSWP